MNHGATSKQKIIGKLSELNAGDLNTKGGNVWAYVYDSGLPELEEVAMEAYDMYKDHNGLDFTVFPSLMKLENDIMDMVIPLFANEQESVEGTFTSGGTESIMLAVKAARDYARVHYPEIKEPEILMPITAHAAFHKAAHYLHLNTVVVPVDKETFKVDPEIIREHITSNTIMLIGSSVNYSHGVSDPIRELGELAEEQDIWLHVDACIGGFLLAYYRKLGHTVAAFDFSIPGVSSLSADLHKYAYTPKGASVVLYRNKELRKYQFYACTNWTGYPVINTTIQSTKSGGPLAACWATLKYVSDEGYLKLTESVRNAKEKLEAHIQSMDDLYILGNPEASLLALTSDAVDIFQLADEMKKREWYIQVQPGVDGMKPSIHLTVTPVSENRTEVFIQDLRKAVETVKQQPRKSVRDYVSNIFASSNQEINTEQLGPLLQMAGVHPDGSLPSEMANINELLDVLPNEVTKEAFLYLANELFTHQPLSTKGDV